MVGNAETGGSRYKYRMMQSFGGTDYESVENRNEDIGRSVDAPEIHITARLNGQEK